MLANTKVEFFEKTGITIGQEYNQYPDFKLYRTISSTINETNSRNWPSCMFGIQVNYAFAIPDSDSYRSSQRLKVPVYCRNENSKQYKTIRTICSKPKMPMLHHKLKKMWHDESYQLRLRQFVQSTKNYWTLLKENQKSAEQSVLLILHCIGKKWNHSA